jgi:phosphoglycolate phosphatase-like HAD superfamily hydrolase
VSESGTVSIAVFDIDGVVADVRHRLHYLEQRPKAWGAFLAAAVADPPLAEGIALLEKLQVDHEIAWLTGRPEWLRQVTVDWLARHGLPTANLVMRADGDYRPARVMKLDAIRSIPPESVAMLVDDDQEVITAVSGAGYRTTLATWVPRSTALRSAQEKSGRT